MSGESSLERVVGALACDLSGLGNEACGECGYSCGKADWMQVQRQLAQDALTLLEQHVPRLMSFAEIAEWHEPMWFERMPTFPGEWCLLREDNGTSYALSFQFGRISCREFDYNRTWRCWTSRPDEKKRKEASWKCLIAKR